MSLLLTAAAVAAVGLMAAGAASGVRQARLSSAVVGKARRDVRGALLAEGATLGDDEETVEVPWGERTITIRVDSGVRARLADRDAPVPPRGQMMSLVLPMPTVRRLGHQLIQEWEPLAVGSWPGGAFSEAELCLALREQATLHHRVRHLLERWPILGLTLDNDGTWEIFVGAEVREHDQLGGLLADVILAAEAWEAAATTLVDVATTVRGAPGAVALPARPALAEGAARMEGAPIAVPLNVRDDG